MHNSRTLLQILPFAPGGRDGVGDYARTLATRLRERYGFQTTFLASHPSSRKKIDDFPIISPFREWPARLSEECNSLVLHFVSYGYQKRGVPFTLMQWMRKIRQNRPARAVTIFHELYASGSWRQSAFWLQSLQKQIIRALAQLSDTAVVSSSVLRDQLRRLAPKVSIVVKPVFSNFGEPILPDDSFARDANRWVICGGTNLVERSVRSFTRVRHLLSDFAPRKLFVIGGANNPAVRQLLQKDTGISSEYLPDIDRNDASEILSSCAFGWIDYFEHENVPTAAILKSTAFAALCAHGVIPVFPAALSSIDLDGDVLAGPWYTAAGECKPPNPAKLPGISLETYQWYRRHALSEGAADLIAEALGLGKPAELA